jgi:hypothetical protein
MSASSHGDSEGIKKGLKKRAVTEENIAAFSGNTQSRST